MTDRELSVKGFNQAYSCFMQLRAHKEIKRDRELRPLPPTLNQFIFLGYIAGHTPKHEAGSSCSKVILRIYSINVFFEDGYECNVMSNQDKSVSVIVTNFSRFSLPTSQSIWSENIA